ncbi:Gag/polymerase/env Polyprotein [Phytophthora cinnamomi]|uniref:Gag/polymerase/env Polyprotein n=1 Tax=Phytophthora cinnamomi TaxID=4785 RepID=UPI00355A640C|nr:Gag/polymerase/env Polyprotein [Phytophthora cinnamomi]
MEQTAAAWDAMTAIARFAETMASQQEELRNLVNTLSNNPSKERRVEGMSMPTFSGKKGDSLDLFLDRVLMYLEAKNIDYNASHNQQRVVAMVASHLKEPAAYWYYASMSSLTTMDTLAEGLRREFVPINLQARLHSELQQLRQRKCTDLDDYIAQFRQLLSQIRGMGDLDQVTWFVQGRVQKTREEVIYRRCQTVSDAMAVAQQYGRSHPNNYPDRMEGANRWVQRGRSSARFARPRLAPQSNQPEPMEIGIVQVSREECRRKRLCNYRKQAGHMLNRCPKSGNAPANRRVVIHFNMARVRVDNRGKPR